MKLLLLLVVLLTLAACQGPSRFQVAQIESPADEVAN
jgi:uncharacterized lipoprotein YajG